MNKQKLSNTLIVFSFLLASAVAPAIAQQADLSRATDVNYEAVLHVLVASGDGAPGTPVPSALSAVSKQVRNDFGTANLKLINTYLGRIANTGSLDYKGVSNAYVQEPQPGSPSFLDWRLVGLQARQDNAGHSVYQFQNFRFGARVPVKIGEATDEKARAPINYEAIGLTLDRISVRENVPTLVGTLTQPRTDGTLFLVLTVKNADK